MADQLASAADLASLLGITMTSPQQTRATLLLELATSIVQTEADGQRIVQVVDDVIAEGDLMGTTDAWLQLPQWPVSAVEDVELDGTPLSAGTDYKRIGSRLWRGCGWATCWTSPSVVTLTYTHGYPTGHQRLQFGRKAALGLAAGVWGNPTGATAERIDDYSVQYDRMMAAMEASPFLRAAIRKAYGAPASLVRLG